MCTGGSRTTATSKMEHSDNTSPFLAVNFYHKCSIVDVAAVLDPPLMWTLQSCWKSNSKMQCRDTSIFQPNRDKALQKLLTIFTSFVVDIWLGPEYVPARPASTQDCHS